MYKITCENQLTWTWQTQQNNRQIAGGTSKTSLPRGQEKSNNLTCNYGVFWIFKQIIVFY